VGGGAHRVSHHQKGNVLFLGRFDDELVGVVLAHAPIGDRYLLFVKGLQFFLGDAPQDRCVGLQKDGVAGPDEFQPADGDVFLVAETQADYV